MLNIPNEIKELIRTDGVRKNFRVHFTNGERADLTNENIVSESARFTESVCSADTFRFGCAEASVVEFEMVGIENIRGMTIECSMEYAVPANMQATYGAWYSVPYGKFVVESCPRDHRDMTHRKVTGYSLIKYMFEVKNFLQNRLLSVPAVHVSMNAINAYVTGDVSPFTEYIVTPQSTSSADWGCNLYDSSGIPYYISLFGDSGAGLRRCDVTARHPNSIYNRSGYIVDYKETGETSGEDIAQLVLDWLEEQEIELLYDASGNKVFESNEEALRSFCGYFWGLMAQDSTTDSSDYIVNYRPYSVDAGVFIPTIKEDRMNSDHFTTHVYYLGEISKVRVNKWSTANIWSSSATNSVLVELPVTGFSSEASFKTYAENTNKLNLIEIGATLAVNSAYGYARAVSTRTKAFYIAMFAFSNAYSNRDLMDGWAELNGAFVHSERDGTISMESLDNTSRYALTGADVVERAWWDEYDVNPIGTVLYTFSNPFTGEIASDSYQFGDGKSVYDLTGNKALEAMDFTTKKAKTVSAMTDKNIFYRYTGSETGYTKDNFYYWNGSQWTSGGEYKTIRSVVEFVLDQIFIPHIQAVNFTPLEMDMRALPYLEAGDAITLTLADGTTLSSYILNHTISGVQRLEDTIDSVSGDVI